MNTISNYIENIVIIFVLIMPILISKVYKKIHSPNLESAYSIKIITKSILINGLVTIHECKNVPSFKEIISMIDLPNNIKTW